MLLVLGILNLILSAIVLFTTGELRLGWVAALLLIVSHFIIKSMKDKNDDNNVRRSERRR